MRFPSLSSKDMIAVHARVDGKDVSEDCYLSASAPESKAIEPTCGRVAFGKKVKADNDARRFAIQNNRKPPEWAVAFDRFYTWVLGEDEEAVEAEFEKAGIPCRWVIAARSLLVYAVRVP